MGLTNTDLQKQHLYQQNSNNICGLLAILLSINTLNNNNNNNKTTTRTTRTRTTT